MSVMDYTKFTKTENKKDAVEPIEIKNRVEEKVEQISMIGTVINCTRLNIRQEPSKESDIVCEIPVYSEVTIYEDESTTDFYKVCTAAGAEGFCMRGFIRTK